MMKILKYIFVLFLLVPLSLASQNFVPKPYLPEAPYDGFAGKVDSIVISSYAAKNGLQSALVTNKVTTAFDKKGYKTLTKTEVLNSDGEMIVYDMEFISRDKKSLPTERISQNQYTRTVYKLEKRENNKETYKVMVYRGYNNIGKDSTTVDKLQTIQYTDTSAVTTLHNKEKLWGKTEIYNSKGKLARMYLHNDKMESILRYDNNGYITQMDIEYDMTSSPNKTLKIFYKNHQVTKYPTYTLITWQQSGDNDEIISFVEQRIYYRK